MIRKISTCFIFYFLIVIYSTNLICHEHIRCFDLGGGGLKTAVVFYDDTNKTMHLISPVFNLGKCPDHISVSTWIREKLQSIASADLDAEIQSKYLFGFSLAALDKLRDKPVKTSDISILFNIPSDVVGTIDDGAAHLLASLKTLKKKLPKGRIWNVSIGTGVGFGFTNSKKEIRPSADLKTFFDQDAWTVKEPLTQQQIWKAGGSKEGFDKIVANGSEGGNKKAFKIFAARWKAFIKQEIINRSTNPEKSWGAPAAIVFTGGHIEYHGNTLVKELKAQGIEVPVFAGPKNAGILGAAWNVVNVEEGGD